MMILRNGKFSGKILRKIFRKGKISMKNFPPHITVYDYRLDDRSSIPGRGKGFFVYSVSRPALRPTQPPFQWIPGVLSLEVKRGRSVTLTIHSHLVPRSGMSRSYTSSPPWRLHGDSGTDLLYFYYCVIL
jgi:hypothetical protein